MKNALYQNQEIRRIESAVIAKNPATEYQLMLQAGMSAFRTLLSEWPLAERLVIVCGKGNNAGDGFVLAREAYLQGFQVMLVTLAECDYYRGPALIAAKACVSAGLHFHAFESGMTFEADVIVDALLGTGLKDEVTGIFAEAIKTINASQCPVLSLDIPSGLHCDSGAVQGSAVIANVTQTFIAFKTGLFTAEGTHHAGKIVLASLDISQDYFKTAAPSAYLLTENVLATQFSKRHRNAHKGDFGHVLIIGGDAGMGGAVQIAAKSALRVGAGLVSVATRAAHVAMMNAACPEVMCHAVATKPDLLPLLKKATVIVIGPGLGQSEWSREFFQAILEAKQPIVLDADALNLLSASPKKHSNWILTPHPGEAARLLACTAKQVQSDRFIVSKKLIAEYGGVIVLKGAGTIVQSENDFPFVCASGNPGMASGGMGDALSGVIGGLLAQQFSLLSAATTGVLIHAMAADAAAQTGGERGLLASDLMPYLRQRVNGY